MGCLSVKQARGISGDDLYVAFYQVCFPFCRANVSSMKGQTTPHYPLSWLLCKPASVHPPRSTREGCELPLSWTVYELQTTSESEKHNVTECSRGHKFLACVSCLKKLHVWAQTKSTQPLIKTYTPLPPSDHLSGFDNIFSRNFLSLSAVCRKLVYVYHRQ